MGDKPHERTIHTVTLEFLRAGPAHNQLLSPLTQYLAVCGEAGATVVNVPWEHAHFLRRLEEMRYEKGTDEDTPRRLAVLEQTGKDVAHLLGSIPALSGLIGNDPVDGELLHLRLVLSASELGLVPYELSKVPSGLQLPTENWLLLQANAPVCLTRHIRSVPYGGVAWDRRPRILFLTSDPEELPYDSHLEALVEAVRPWLHPGQQNPVAGDDGAIRYGDILTVVPDAKIQDIQTICERDTYTHVHILAHGGVDDTSETLSYGIGLHGEIITGSRFASAVTTSTDERVERPTVVTLACCDSANVGSVISAGASFAHALHEAGVPMIVASQFPLSFEGSTTAVKRMYEPRDGLLWGRNPLLMLHELRRSLQISNEAHSHDWASLVVYEALPPDLEEQLATYDHNQAERALKAAEEQFREVKRTCRRGKSHVKEIDKLVETAVSLSELARRSFSDTGPYAVEALALKAASFKRHAEVEFRLAEIDAKPRYSDQQYSDDHMRNSFAALDAAYESYRDAVAGFMNPQNASQMKAQLHYVCGQMLALGTVLGKEEVTGGFWEMSQLSARAYARLRSDDERAWALCTLIELNLLGVMDKSLGPYDVAEYEVKATQYATDLIELMPKRGVIQVHKTCKQLWRYAHWWGSDPFREFLTNEDIKRRWDVGGVSAKAAKVATNILEILAPRLWKRQRHGW